MQDVVREIHKSVRHKFPSRKYTIKSLNDLHCSDLIDIKNLAQYNRGYKWILIDINAFSKLAKAVPLKNKEGKTVAAAYEKIILESPQPWKNLETDRGKEYYNSDFQKIMQKYNIRHYSSF